MHELSITQAILDTALEHAERAHAQAIRVLYLRIGALSGVASESVQFYFDLLSPGTRAEKARLEFERVAPRVRCRACGAVKNWDPGFDSIREAYAMLPSLEPCACGAKDYHLEGDVSCVLNEMDVD
jgi:hydrogenase nickel insertion protein HypA